MTREEALKVLGLPEDASVDDVKEAYQKRMRKYLYTDWGEEKELAEYRKKQLYEASLAAVGYDLKENFTVRVGWKTKLLRKIVGYGWVIVMVTAVILASIVIADVRNDYEQGAVWTLTDAERQALSLERIETVRNSEIPFNFEDHLIEAKLPYEDPEETFHDEDGYLIAADATKRYHDLLAILELHDSKETLVALAGQDRYNDYSRNGRFEKDRFDMVAEFLGAPAYEDIAGMTDGYSGKPITDYNVYMDFIVNVALVQAEDVIGEELIRPEGKFWETIGIFEEKDGVYLFKRKEEEMKTWPGAVSLDQE